MTMNLAAAGRQDPQKENLQDLLQSLPRMQVQLGDRLGTDDSLNRKNQHPDQKISVQLRPKVPGKNSSSNSRPK